jgi:hypothetical protein
MAAREVEEFLSLLRSFENILNNSCLFVDKTFREKVAIIKEIRRQNDILRKIVDKNYNLMHIDDHNKFKSVQRNYFKFCLICIGCNCLFCTCVKK